MGFKSFITMFSRFALPSACLLCDKHTSLPICPACEKDLPTLGTSCTRCARILSTAAKVQCGACLQSPPPFDCTFALFPYEQPIIQLIAQLKFGHQLSCARALGKIFCQNMLNKWYVNAALPDLIIPIPLHPKRLRMRGFNQALEIAKEISKFFNIPIDHSTTRIKATIAQSHLPASRRQKNVAHAFIFNRSYQDLTVAVMDDVITTSYTMNEFCGGLRKNGVKKIHVWCCARSQR